MNNLAKLAISLVLLVLLAIGHNLVRYAQDPVLAFILGALVYGGIVWSFIQVWGSKPKKGA